MALGAGAAASAGFADIAEGLEIRGKRDSESGLVRASLAWPGKEKGRGEEEKEIIFNFQFSNFH